MTAAVSPDVPQALSGGRLTIDLGALADNWKALAGRAGSAQCGAAVKADAYGIGLEPAAVALWGAGCRTFFVAIPDEGLRLRKTLPQADIYILNGLFDGAQTVLEGARLRPVLGSLEEIHSWADHCSVRGQRLPAALHVDTGINRLGLAFEEAKGLARSGLPGSIEWSLLMSHLACADEPDHPQNGRQHDCFERCRALFPNLPASLSNSAAILSRPDLSHDLVRPGIALYGGEAVSGIDNPMLPVVGLEGRIIQVRDVAQGEAVGYGATETAKRVSRIALLSLGYADGYHRLAGSTDRAPGARGWLAGHYVPLFGRVSMDMLAVDVTDVPPKQARRGGWVELIGPHVPLDEVARSAQTVGYEILTQLGSRYHRVYVGGPEAG